MADPTTSFYNPLVTRAVGNPDAIRDRAIETLQLVFPAVRLVPSVMLYHAFDALAEEAGTSEQIAMGDLEPVNDSWAQQYVGISPEPATSAVAAATVTAVDTAGYTLEDGHPVTIGGVQFQVNGDTQVVAGTSTAAVQLIAVAPGAAGNAAAGDVVDQGDESWIASFVLVDAPSGGGDGDDLPTFREKAAREARVLGSASTEDEFALKVLNVDGVSRVLVLNGYTPPPSESYTAENAVGIFLADDQGEPVAAPVKATVTALAAAQRLTNILVSVLDPTYTSVNVVATITVRDGYDPDEVADAVTVAVQTLLSPAVWAGPASEDGQINTWTALATVYRSDVEAAIKQVGGVQQVTACTVGGTDHVTLSGPAPLTQPGTVTITTA